MGRSNFRKAPNQLNHMSANVTSGVRLQRGEYLASRRVTRKRYAVVAFFSAVVFTGVVFAQGPAPVYRWSFNQNDVSPGTTNIIPDVGSEAILEMVLADGVTRTNLFSVNGGGVSGNLQCYTNDRALELNLGTMGGSGPIARTPNADHVLTNLGVLKQFTITAWIKADDVFSGFPRILMLTSQNGDTGDTGPMITFLQYNWWAAGIMNTLQLKVNGANQTSSGGLIAPSGMLAASTNWIFLAVTYDATIDGLVDSNVNFYVGNRTDPLGPPVASMAYSVTTIYTGLYDCAQNNPGPVIFNPDAGGIYPWVYIANRNSDRNRAFKGRYDDIRIYNTVLTREQLEAVRQEACPWAPQPLQITRHPADTTVVAGQGAAFTVETTDAPNLSYQWYVSLDGGATSNAIAGATNKFYRTQPLSETDSGKKYAVRVSSTDPIAGTVFSSFATVTVLATNALTWTPGMLKFEYFGGAPGTSVEQFLGSPTENYPYAPDMSLYIPTFDSRAVLPDNGSYNNYFVRITGWIIPQVTTNYVFYLRASDTAQLWLSTDDSTNNLQLIATDPWGGGQVFYGPETITPVAPPNTTVPVSIPILLQAGQKYAVQAFYKAALAGGFIQVAWRVNNDPYTNELPSKIEDIADRLYPIDSAFLACIGLSNGSLTITQHPAGATVPVNSRVTMQVGAAMSGAGPLVIQWQCNGTNIPGATGTSYTTPYLVNPGQYRAIVSAPGLCVTSTVANVMITSDTVKPTVVAASPTGDSLYNVLVRFSEPVDPATALDTNNYSISGLGVIGAELVATKDSMGNTVYDAVKLITTRQEHDTPYVLTVVNVRDTANNVIATANTATFRSYGYIPGFAKVQYFENQTLNPNIYWWDDGSMGFLLQESLKVRNDDADTIVYPRRLGFSPQGGTVWRSAVGGTYMNYVLGGLTPAYATRLKAIITPTNTGNYAFYITADDSAILWLSTDDNPINKCIIAYQAAPVSGQYEGAWTTAAEADPNTCSATFNTNLIGTVITVPGARPWPSGNTITLQAGKRYYLQADHREHSGWNSYCAVTWDAGTGTTPPNGTPALSGPAIGWYFPQPLITSYSRIGNNLVIAWTNAFGLEQLGAVPYPGIRPGSIDPSFPEPKLLTAPTVLGPWTVISNNSPVTIPMNEPRQFFRVAQ